MPAENYENFRDLPDIMTMTDVWKCLGIGKHTAYKMAREDPNFPTLRFGRSIRVPKRLFVEWMENRCLEEQAKAAQLLAEEAQAKVEETLDGAPLDTPQYEGSHDDEE